MTKKLTKQVRDFCSDSNGRLVLAQSPNLPIVGWMGFTFASILTTNQQLKVGFRLIGTALLFTWAYLEVTEGGSNFRKLLGALVMLFTILSLLRT